MSAKMLTSKPFDVSVIVTCGYCRGTGVNDTLVNGRLVCPHCGGDGRLRRRAKGVVEMYPLENNEKIISNNKQ